MTRQKSEHVVTGPKWTFLDLWSVVLGGWVGLALIKFGNPVILDHIATRSDDNGLGGDPSISFKVGVGLLLVLAIIAFKMGFRRMNYSKFLWVPLVWLCWQLIASFKTVDTQLTSYTLIHFFCCVSCFYLGWQVLSRQKNPIYWTCGIALCFFFVVLTGFQQHFGGFEATREWFFSQPNWKSYPTEFIKKVSSNRIYATLVYPNAFAGVILLLLPLMLWTAFRMTRRFGNIGLGVGVGLLGYAALASLYWTESKTGWLLAMGLVFLIVLHLDFSRKVKIGLIIGLVILGVGAFSFKYADYFKRGATSVTARFDYWEAAWKTFKANPVLGTGPGTFKHAYARLKRPESEMARLAHNDYLEQASDSGLIGFLAFAGIFPYSLIRLHRKARQGGVVFAVWLGLVGWALQGLVEFSLYIPALAWPAFLLLGWLWGWEGNGGISAAKKTGAIKSATT